MELEEREKLSKDTIIQTDDPLSFENQKFIHEEFSGRKLTPREEVGLRRVLDMHNEEIREEQSTHGI